MAEDQDLLFVVVGANAVPTERITLAEAGLYERQHLQEWVAANPMMLGEHVTVVATEFDQWQTHTVEAAADRLDILGLDADGRLVVAELKRDSAPEVTALQALKYAAMVSRFTPELLAEKFAAYLSSRGEPTTSEEAAERINVHVDYELDAESFRNPRIILLATDFPATLTATVVWLNERGLDVTLREFRAYRTENDTLVAVSQLYPVRDVEEFAIAPRRSRTSASEAELPEIPWTVEDLARLRRLTSNQTILALLDLTAERTGEWVPFADLVAETGRAVAQSRGDLASLTRLVKRDFDRSNWPVLVEWRLDTTSQHQAHYFMREDVAALWRRTDGYITE